MQICPNSNYVASYWNGNRELFIHDINNGKIIKVFEVCGYIDKIIGWIDSNRILVLTQDGLLKIYNINKYLIQPTSFPILEISNVQIIDSTKDGNVEFNEPAAMKFRISNIGTGQAFNVIMQEVYQYDERDEHVSILPANNKDISIVKSKGVTIKCEDESFSQSILIGDIEANSYVDVTIPFTNSFPIDKDCSFKMAYNFYEKYGFPPDTLVFDIKLGKFENPVLVSEISGISTTSGTVQKGQSVQISLELKNVGQKTVENIRVWLKYPEENVFLLSEDRFKIPTLAKGESKIIQFEIIPNKIFVGEELNLDFLISADWIENKTISTNIKFGSKVAVTK